jgi:hypothetical protein
VGSVLQHLVVRESKDLRVCRQQEQRHSQEIGEELHAVKCSTARVMPVLQIPLDTLIITSYDTT